MDWDLTKSRETHAFSSLAFPGFFRSADMPSSFWQAIVENINLGKRKRPCLQCNAESNVPSPEIDYSQIARYNISFRSSSSLTPFWRYT